MAKEYDISNMSLDEIETAVGDYNPYDPVEPPSFSPSLRDEPPEIISNEKMFGPTQEPPDIINDEEMFDSEGYHYEFLGLELPTKPTEAVKGAIEKGTSLASKGIWKGLGLLSWPFERIEYGIGTPFTQIVKTTGPLGSIARKFTMETALDTPAAKSLYKSRVRNMLTEHSKTVLGDRLEPMLEDQVTRLANGWLTHEELMSNLTEAKEQSKELFPAFLTGAKSFVPFTRNDPEKVKNFNDVWAAYYEEMTGEQAPSWLTQTAGIATSFLVTPFVFSKMLKFARVGISKLPFVQQVLKNRLPTWKDAKLIRRANIYERNERAVQIGKQLANKDAQRIANQLSLKTGKNITKEAVKKRFGQIIKGSITQQGAFKEAANPAIEELSKNFDELQKLGILSEETYLTKLTKSKIKQLNNKKINLTSQLTKLEKDVPYQRVLMQKIAALHPDITKQQRIADKLIKIAAKAEKQGVSFDTYLDELIETAYEVRAGSPLAKNVASLVDIKPGNKRLTMMANRILKLEKMERVARQKEAKSILNTAAKFEKRISSNTEKIVNDLMVTADQVEDFRIIGQGPLLKYVANMKRTFPGKAKKIRDLQSQIEDIDLTLWKSTHFGGSGKLYMPRMYLTKEADVKKAFPLKGGPKVRAKYGKQRKEIPLELRKEMGEIFEPAYPVTKRLIQEAQDIETAKLFNFAASKGEWVDDVWRAGLHPEAIPTGKQYGALAGKYVHPRIYNDIKEITYARGNIESFYDSFIGSWKTGKVVLSPSTHFRNTFSNSVLLDLSGTDHIQQGRLFVKALGEIKGKTEEYKIAKKFFKHTTMMQAEVMDDLMRTVQADKASGLQKSINTWNKVYGKATAGPRAVYQEEEFIFKFMKYIEQREKGMSVMKSVNEANKWLFDYSDLSSFEKKYVRRVMPFYTFPRKALPRIIEAAEKNPLGLAKYPMLAWAEEKYALHQLELTDKDYEDIQKILPEYMQRGSYMLMPFRDQNGDLLFFDWTYIVPWGELYDVQDRGLLGAVVTNPLFQITADITRNRSGFSGREIYMETDTTKEKTFKSLMHVWQSAMPSLMYKGIYWDKLYNAATGKPSKMGDITPLAPTIAHTIFGARTTAIDVEEQAAYKEFERLRKVEELESKISDIAIREANGNITEEEYDQKREQYIRQINELFTEETE